jgi:8-oxo-dGTP pyrophosphatase MutT (NUDIX family)
VVGVSIIDKLNNYKLRFPEESDSTGDFIQFITQTPNYLDRNTSNAHVTGSAWLLNLDKTKVLLTHHKKLNSWCQLGGHADGETDVLKVAIREAKEESGIIGIIPISSDIFDISKHYIPKRGDCDAHYHYDITFALQVTDSEEYRVSAESFDLEWVEIDKVLEYANNSTMDRMYSKWLKYNE